MFFPVRQCTEKTSLIAISTSVKFKNKVKHSHLYFTGSVVLVCVLSLDVGTHLWPREINMIGQIASTGSLFPLLHDLSLSTANSGSSYRTHDCINILCWAHGGGFGAYVGCCEV